MNKSSVIGFLRRVPDPEVPALNIVDLGIVRDVLLEGDSVEVVITPTYSGCPAMQVIEENIVSVLREQGIEKVQLKTVLSPAWTTDWLSDEAKTKLREYGIAPPQKRQGEIDILTEESVAVNCPHCGSSRTVQKSFFGSTACKALYVCSDCKEPFDYFKPF